MVRPYFHMKLLMFFENSLSATIGSCYPYREPSSISLSGGQTLFHRGVNSQIPSAYFPEDPRNPRVTAIETSDMKQTSDIIHTSQSRHTSDITIDIHQILDIPQILDIHQRFVHFYFVTPFFRDTFSQQCWSSLRFTSCSRGVRSGCHIISCHIISFYIIA